VPFAQLTPRPFTSGGVETYAPAASGVYGISNAIEWIFIGQTNDIRGSLLDHLQDFDTSLLKKQPTGFVYEICDAGHRAARHDRLIREYEPACNRHSSRR
jgi:hypothetical protein